ncbi:MAG: PAS domain S-box-containing protein [Glaciecola sp.]|jgi:PAS domain S-box-containing protein
MNISLMILDNNPVSRHTIKNTIKDINNNIDASVTNESNNSGFTNKPIKLYVHENDNFRDAIDTINELKIDIIIINISSINIDNYKDDCKKLRNIYPLSPIIAISNSASAFNLEHYDYIDFDDILNIKIITPHILLRTITSAIHRSKNYNSFHTSHQRKIISSSLLELLLDKKSLITVAESACQIINSQSSNSNYSSASIYTIHEDKVERIAHSGAQDSEDKIFNYQKKIYSLKYSKELENDFYYLKESIKRKISVTIPLQNKDIVFAFLKIETEHDVIHHSKENDYYKDISKTLSDVFILAQERERFEQVYRQNVRLIDEMSSAAIGIDKYDLVTHWNHQAELYFGISKSDAIQKRLFELNIICDWPIIIAKLYDSLNKSVNTEKFDVSYQRDGEEDNRILSVAITPFVEPNGSFSGYLLLMDDITEKRHLEKRHQQSMYLESIGQLSAGIAHEINTPMQYISDNLSFLKESFDDTTEALLEIKLSLIHNTLDIEKLNSIFKKSDFEYLSKELPLAFAQTTEGVNRVCTIVKAMKEFSHPNAEDKVATNINSCIESTITISKHTWKYHAKMEVDLDPNIKDVMCHPGPFNEVILNIIVNAADAIKEKVENDNSVDMGEIKIQTRGKDDFAEIRISDTGGGIPKSIQEKIFDPFFTTKAIGKGTGQGLALSYSIIKVRHNGELLFETVPGESTTFILQLPYQ